MWQMVGILAELERSLIQKRTKASRAVAVARGVRMGRKRLLSAQQVAHARKLIEQGEDADRETFPAPVLYSGRSHNLFPVYRPYCAPP